MIICRRRVFWVLCFLLCARLISMMIVPLNDSTEARYGDIARMMLETGDWVTPMHDYGVPFWAKPPLSTWESALSMKLFGVNEFAARLPALLLSLVILWLVWGLAKTRSCEFIAKTSVLVLAGSLYFFLDAGTVMTDPSLLFCTTLTWVAFWRAVELRQRLWSYLFFVGLGLGLLAKGPVAVVLVGLPLFFWVLINKKWRVLWSALPWGYGFLLTLMIAGPWYLLAELKTPGFLNYFIVGEHFHRFVDPGWAGDKYGTAHVAPYGMIWLYAFIGTLPWSVVGLPLLLRYVRASLCRMRSWLVMPTRFCTGNVDAWQSYLLLGFVVPLLFFTVARNIIYPYVFPVLPAFALLVAQGVYNGDSVKWWVDKRIDLYALLVGVLFLIGTLGFVFIPEVVGKSQDRVVAAWRLLPISPGSKLIYWAQSVDYSARFYSRGQAVAALQVADLRALLAQHPDSYIVVRAGNLEKMPADLRDRLRKITVIKVRKVSYTLFSVLNNTSSRLGLGPTGCGMNAELVGPRPNLPVIPKSRVSRQVSIFSQSK